MPIEQFEIYSAFFISSSIIINFYLCFDTYKNKKVIKNQNSDIENIKSEIHQKNEELHKNSIEINSLANNITNLESTLKEKKELFNNKEEELLLLRKDNSEKSNKITELTINIEHLHKEASKEKERIKEMKNILESEVKELSTKFWNQNANIIKSNTENLSKTAENSLNSLIKPMKDKLDRIDHFKVELEKGRFSTETAIKNFMNTEMEMKRTTENLTNALKGNSKVQGDWGEIILERILKTAGLETDKDYKTQLSMKNHDGKDIRPDVVIKMPGDQYVIIDSKVTSLNGYDNYCNTDDKDEQNIYFNTLTSSIKNHIEDLNKKNYTDVKGHFEDKFPDFVLMFIPLEGAYYAILNDKKQRIYEWAWKKKVVLVGPSALFATLKVIANTLKIDKQNRNSAEIAKETALFYDRFVEFCQNLIDMETCLNQSQKQNELAIKSCGLAMKKLTFGNESLINKAQKIELMGVKPKKKIPESLTNLSLIENS